MEIQPLAASFFSASYRRFYILLKASLFTTGPTDPHCTNPNENFGGKAP